MTACRACLHPAREAIDKDLVCEVNSVRALAQKYGLSTTGLRNHRITHLFQPLLRKYLDETPNALEEMAEILAQRLRRAVESDDGRVSLEGIKLAYRVLGVC